MIYLVLTIAGFGVLRWRGYPVTYVDVAWPPRLWNFHQIQARYFAQRAQEDLQRNDVAAALMALSIAYTRDPSNYAIGRLFARLSQAAQPALADRVYAQLVAEHPEQRSETLAAWFESLLWRGDFASIVTLGRQSLITEGPSAAWVNAILFSQRREPDLTLLKSLADDARLGEAQEIFQLEYRSHLDPTAARADLRQRASGTLASFRDFYRIKRLVEIGDAAIALEVLKGTEHALPSRDVVMLRLEAFSALGWTSLLRAEVESIAGPQMNAAAAELLCAFLIRHPEDELFRLAFDAYNRLPKEKSDAAYKVWSSWFVTAGVHADYGRIRAAEAELQRITGTTLKTTRQIEAFFRGESASSRIESYLPAMQPLPLDVTYALLERYYRPRPAAGPTRP